MAASAAAVAPGAPGLMPAIEPPGANGDIVAIIVFCTGLAAWYAGWAGGGPPCCGGAAAGVPGICAIIVFCWPPCCGGGMYGWAAGGGGPPPPWGGGIPGSCGPPMPAIIVRCGLPPAALAAAAPAAPALSSVNTCWQVCIMSPADWKRRPGSLSRALRTMFTTAGGSPPGSGGTSARRCICSTAIGLSSLNGTWPTSIS